jgi:hypothetical protein
MKSSDIICACCGKHIVQRKCFKLVFQTRDKYHSYWHQVPLELYFHIPCVRKISIKARDVYDLLALMGKIKGEDLLV